MIARRLFGFRRSADAAGRRRSPIHLGFYSPANLNTMDGSAIWVESAIETFHVDDRLRISLLLKAPERRTIITDTIRRLERVDVITRPAGGTVLDAAAAMDALEDLDRRDRIDVLVLRSYEVCLEAARRGTFDGRLWACYVLEPERDLESDDHRAGLRRIVDHASQVLVQSRPMADLLVSVVPEAAPKLLSLPPAVPPDDRHVADPRRPIRRLLYTGKFHPFYRIEELIDAFVALRLEEPALSFHVVGDKVFQPPDDAEWAPALRRRLRTTEGLVWHGALPRPEVLRLLSGGGLALSIWDYDHGSRTNDLVVSTKLLDYAVSGLPVLLTRTIAQEALLGTDYPLFHAPHDAIATSIRGVLADPERAVAAAGKTRAMAQAFTYPAVYAGLRPAIDEIAAGLPAPDAP
jgi:glycosyltransferase involved in cell wall biosynthesis